MTYQIVTPKGVQKQIMALPIEIARRIDEAILALAEDPRPDGVVKMKGGDQEYRIRVGDYRIVYKINDEQLIILLFQCRHRKDVYRNR
jgi:mRNA interferase RelE/StbE